MNIKSYVSNGDLFDFQGFALASKLHCCDVSNSGLFWETFQFQQKTFSIWITLHSGAQTFKRSSIDQNVFLIDGDPTFTAAGNSLHPKEIIFLHLHEFHITISTFFFITTCYFSDQTSGDLARAYMCMWLHLPLRIFFITTCSCWFLYHWLTVFAFWAPVKWLTCAS